MVTNNSIALTATGLVGYDGAGTFNASTITGGAVVVGAGSTSTYSSVSPPNLTGVPLVSQTGINFPPVFGTCDVRGGGTGLTTLTTNELMASGTSSTGNMQQISSGTSGQLLVSNGSSSLPSFQTPANVFTWTDQSSNFTASAANGYFCTLAITVTLPATPANGNTITVYNSFGASIVVQANTGQTIRIAGSVSSSAGTATSAAVGDSVTLVYRASGTVWSSPASEGSWVLV